MIEKIIWQTPTGKVKFLHDGEALCFMENDGMRTPIIAFHLLKDFALDILRYCETGLGYVDEGKDE